MRVAARFLGLSFLGSMALLANAQDAPPPTQGHPVIMERVLNPNEVIIVPTAPGLTTTLQFPRPIRSVDGEGISEKHDTESLFTASYTRGVQSKTISFSPLYTKARTNVNIMVGDEVFVFVLMVDFEKAIFKLNLKDPPPPVPPVIENDKPLVLIPEKRDLLRPSPAQLLGLLDKCKAYPILGEEDKATDDIIQGLPPWPMTKGDGYEIEPLHIYRKGAWDALIFEVLITNTTDKKLFYNPESWMVNPGGPLSFRSALSDAGGVVPPLKTAKAWFVVRGDGEQGTNNLSPDNKWTITFQPIEEGEVTSLADAKEVSQILPPLPRTMIPQEDKTTQQKGLLNPAPLAPLPTR
ncbi:MAG: hypothetical protein RL693_155 [Verrucomicrobiota bacterium]|jgi:hypothetical protein